MSGCSCVLGIRTTVQQLVAVAVVREVFEIVDRIQRDGNRHGHRLHSEHSVCPLDLQSLSRRLTPRSTTQRAVRARRLGFLWTSRRACPACGDPHDVSSTEQPLEDSWHADIRVDVRPVQSLARRIDLHVRELR
jgi:hypothetical protein